VLTRGGFRSWPTSTHRLPFRCAARVYVLSPGFGSPVWEPGSGAWLSWSYPKLGTSGSVSLLVWARSGRRFQRGAPPEVLALVPGWWAGRNWAPCPTRTTRRGARAPPRADDVGRGPGHRCLVVDSTDLSDAFTGPLLALGQSTMAGRCGAVHPAAMRPRPLARLARGSTSGATMLIWVL